MNQFGHVRTTVVSPEVSIANPAANRRFICDALDQCRDSDVVVFPELCMTGYTCGDLFRQKILLDAAEAEVGRIVRHTTDRKQLVWVGAPIRVGVELFNCAIAINNGHIIGIVPKQNIPEGNEFYEGRHFAAADGDEPHGILYAGGPVEFGIDLVFPAYGTNSKLSGLIVFAEICEDLWMPIPPSSLACLEGANLMVNLSGSDETVAKDEYRMELIRNQSGRCIAAYAYSSARSSESTTDLVFGGHCVLAENGTVLAETDHIGDGKLSYTQKMAMATVDFDVERLNTDRHVQRSFGEGRRRLAVPFRRCNWQVEHRVAKRSTPSLKRYVPALPFVPSNPETLAKRCAAVFDIQCAALAGRLNDMKRKFNDYPDMNIGVSGGSDSTHALLVMHKTVQSLGLAPSKIKAVTMPGFGTTSKSQDIAVRLMGNLNVTSDTIDIRPQCLQMFKDLKHRPFGINVLDGTAPDGTISLEEFMVALRKLTPEQRQKGDLTFENVQAGIRTSILMRRGFTIGTGDLSELALGWCTYGVGDHMSHYGVNAGVPKTLVKFMIKYVAGNHYEAGSLRECLLDCAGLTISPELLPALEGEQVAQSTESILGPYACHDFFLFNFVRCGFDPNKILYLAMHSDLAKWFTEDVIVATMKTFIARFFGQQWKRDCVPGAPKVGSVSLSPRGDWRMPADASPDLWLNLIDNE